MPEATPDTQTNVGLDSVGSSRGDAFGVQIDMTRVDQISNICTPPPLHDRYDVIGYHQPPLDSNGTSGVYKKRSNWF